MKLIVYSPKPFEIKALSPNDLCNIYDISQHILKLWLADLPDLGELKGNRYNIAQVTMILERYGVPGHFVKLVPDEERPELYVSPLKVNRGDDDNSQQFEKIPKAA